MTTYSHSHPITGTAFDCGKFRIFKCTGDEDFRKVDVVVTIGGILPSNGGTVTLVCMDPPNASGTGAANNDSIGTGIFFGASTKTISFFSGVSMTQTVTASVGTYAGDNYIIEATPSSGEPLKESKQLTVWRRLWVESDTMQNAAGQLAGYPQISGLPEEQYARACIQLEWYSQPELSEIIAPFEGVVVQEHPITHSLIISSTLVSAVATQRYIPQPTKDFWTVHLIGSFYWLDELNNIQGEYGWAPSPIPKIGFAGIPNTAFIFMTKMKDDIDSSPYFSGLSSQDKQKLTAKLRQYCVAHEIGHLMYLGHASVPVVSIMRSISDLQDLTTTPDYLKFTVDEILALQKIEMPR